ncbi:hypothetical protein BV509_09255 [Rhodovulum sulfidophilum]|uniref:Uncharacterized protein n=1 Tax=Rhodovulum visakhapatnamense TaxID=364297 RepID=A0ABS1RHQ0_9RHOB|nr:hypothetical protein [Rhodovulum visakhapatnamense]MBL3571204.1 hypothetical protein [Rhodovulum visakhapatnamense]MBL3579183.1 hypothetical protein [Rhodovulum visakhapatnamense]OLS44510.1 hypothetical protein BV509_09255 [Rhodovulum sulfidophilum]
MQDPQYRDFQNRLQRVAEMQRSGRAFETADTSRMAAPRRPRHALNLPLWRSLGVMAATVTLVKVGILVQIGAPAYAERLALAESRTPVERAAAAVMQIDPATGWVARGVSALLGRGR